MFTIVLDVQVKAEAGFVHAKNVPGFDLKKLNSAEMKISDTSTYTGLIIKKLKIGGGVGNVHLLTC